MLFEMVSPQISPLTQSTTNICNTIFSSVRYQTTHRNKVVFSLGLLKEPHRYIDGIAPKRCTH